MCYEIHLFSQCVYPCGNSCGETRVYVNVRCLTNTETKIVAIRSGQFCKTVRCKGTYYCVKCAWLRLHVSIDIVNSGVSIMRAIFGRILRKSAPSDMVLNFSICVLKL
jgi:hypothetical protein